MYQAPARVWNEIARTQTLKTAWAKRMFPLDSETMAEWLDEELDRIAATGPSKALVASYLKIMPLLWENEAIAEFVTTNPDLIPALPSVESVKEAVLIATMDYRMDEAEQEELADLLNQKPK